MNIIHKKKINHNSINKRSYKTIPLNLIFSLNKNKLNYLIEIFK